jgi:hypothetical protein
MRAYLLERKDLNELKAVDVIAKRDVAAVPKYHTQREDLRKGAFRRASRRKILPKYCPK